MATGTVVKTADGIVGVSGKPVRIFAVNNVSGGTAGDVVLRNGTTAAGTVYVQLTGTANAGTAWDFHEGVLFPDGCFYDHDSNNTFATITYSQERI